MEGTLQELSNSHRELLAQRDNKEREVVQRLTVDHELEVADHRRAQEVKEEKIRSLVEENGRLEGLVEKCEQQRENLSEEIVRVKEDYSRRIDDLERQVKEVLDEKEKAVKDTTERLHQEHKAEMESIRSRFKLMVSERSPSESSLEKFEFRDESSSKVEEAVAQEMRRWQRKVEELQIQHEIFLEDIRKQITEEKDKQIMMLQERVANLNLECMKHKNTIQQLAESDVQTQNSELAKKLDIFEREKKELQAELDRMKQQDLTSSVAVDAATSPVKHKGLTKNQSSLMKPSSVSINSCKLGDLVLVVWNQQHENYTLLQESKYMFFLHSECLEPLGLKPATPEQRKLYCIGEVVDKEYCHARKVGNENENNVTTYSFYRRITGSEFRKVLVSTV